MSNHSITIIAITAEIIKLTIFFVIYFALLQGRSVRRCGLCRARPPQPRPESVVGPARRRHGRLGEGGLAAGPSDAVRARLQAEGRQVRHYVFGNKSKGGDSIQLTKNGNENSTQNALELMGLKYYEKVPILHTFTGVLFTFVGILCGIFGGILQLNCQPLHCTQYFSNGNK